MNYQLTRKINLAFLGGGINSAVGSAHYASINIDNIFELKAGVFSREKEINLNSAKSYNLQDHCAYNNIEDLVSKEKGLIDAIVVLTPTNQHFEQVSMLVRLGFPIICEKALVSNVDEGFKIKSLINEKNGFLSVIYNYLGYPLIRELKNLIEKGQFGKIKHIQIEMPQESFAKIDKEGKPRIPQDWRLKDNTIPTISLDLGVHLHMLIKYLTNEVPINVVAKGDSLGNFNQIIDNINCIIEYSNNITCNMWFSKIAIGNRNGLKIRIFGEYGSAEWLQILPGVINLADNAGRRWKIDRGSPDVSICNLARYARFKEGHPQGFIEAFANYYQDIALALEKYNDTGEVNLIDCFGVDETIEGLKLFEAIQKSCMSRKWETI